MLVVRDCYWGGCEEGGNSWSRSGVCVACRGDERVHGCKSMVGSWCIGKVAMQV